MDTQSISTDLQDVLVELTGAPARSLDEPTLDLPEVWGHGSFPASDPPANW